MFKWTRADRPSRPAAGAAFKPPAAGVHPHGRPAPEGGPRAARAASRSPMPAAGVATGGAALSGAAHALGVLTVEFSLKGSLSLAGGFLALGPHTGVAVVGGVGVAGDFSHEPMRDGSPI